jgi:hypothetical protein
MTLNLTQLIVALEVARSSLIDNDKNPDMPCYIMLKDGKGVDIRKAGIVEYRKGNVRTFVFELDTRP